MATLYRNPAGADNRNSTSAWALTPTGTPDQPAPVAGDTVYFTNNNSNTCTITANAACANLDFTSGTGFTGTFAGSDGSVTITGNLTLSSGMILTYNRGFTLSPPVSTTSTVTIAGKTISGNFNHGGSGTVLLADNLILSPGGLNRNGTGNFDFTTNSVTVSMTGTFQTITGIITFYNLTRTSTASKTNTLTLTGNITVNNIFTATGNSKINRLHIRSNTIGTARTITTATVSVNACDFEDITGAGDGDWDLSGVSDYSGDCGGNSGITFTTPVTTTCSAGTTWSTATRDERVPLPQDTAEFSGSSRTITQDMPRIGSVDFTGSSGLTWTTSTACTCYGSINLTDLGTLTNSTQTYTFGGRGSNTLTSAGKEWNKSISINAASGTYTLKNNIVNVSLSDTLTINTGTLTCVDGNNNWEIEYPQVAVNAGGTLSLGDGTHKILRAAGTPRNVVGNINAGNSTIRMTGSSSSVIQFNGGGRTYNNLWINNASTNYNQINGNNTFNDFKIDAGREVRFANSTTTTVNTFTALGTSGSRITLSNTSSTTKATLTKSGGGVIEGCDYIDASNLTGSPDLTWYIGANSTVTNCTNIYAEGGTVTNTSNFFTYL